MTDELRSPVNSAQGKRQLADATFEVGVAAERLLDAIHEYGAPRPVLVAAAALQAAIDQVANALQAKSVNPAMTTLIRAAVCPRCHGRIKMAMVFVGCTCLHPDVSEHASHCAGTWINCEHEFHDALDALREPLT